MNTTLTRNEVAELMRISPQALTNRIARREPHPPFFSISPRRRIWMLVEVKRWLREHRIKAKPQRNLFEPLNFKAPSRKQRQAQELIKDAKRQARKSARSGT